METMTDSELLAEAKKAKLEFKPVDGSTIAKTFAGFYELNPATKDKLRAIVLPGKQSSN
ncbi:MAG: hypothetical protein HY695_09410 [Deltaproteobacteria bacterium]|nr:hypothetical protein [Deltaproteobacteria bacterium]